MESVICTSIIGIVMRKDYKWKLEITVVEVPEGYTVTTRKTGKATVEENKVAEHVAKVDTATGGLTIIVRDEKTDDPVPRATVEIKYPDGTVETKVTDKNGEINYPADPGVPTGDYEITVIDVPDGYTVTTGKTGKVTVKEDKVAKHVAKVDVSDDSTSRDDDEDEDETDEETSAETDDGKDSDSSAKTGDNSPVKPLTAIMLIALITFAILFYLRRRNSAY